MRLAIDASRTTVARVTGTEHYALALIRAIIRQNTTHDITLYSATSRMRPCFQRPSASARG